MTAPRSPRFAIVERRDGGRGCAPAVNIVLYHDADPLIRMRTNCGERDAIGIAALLNDAIESVEIVRRATK